MSGARLRVAVLGAGTVGREVVRALLERPDDLRPADGAALALTAVAVRDVGRAVTAGLPASLLSDAPAHLVADDEIDVIVELMGGDEPAHTLIAAALSMGKPVVTANKHVIAHHGPELEAIARRTGASLRFEAAVGGGIPVLGPLASDLAANRISRVRGIVNGTTNFILSAMTDEDGAARLRRGPGRGPAARLRGGRSGRRHRGPRRGQQAGHPGPPRVRPLARPGRDPDPPGRGRRPGRTRDHHGHPRRPGGRAPRRADHPAGRDGVGRRRRRRVAAAVLPTALPRDSALGRTAGVRNRIEIDATPVGRVGFDGPGAGGAATSSAVLGDLIAIARGRGLDLGAATAGDRPPRARARPPDPRLPRRRERRPVPDR